MKVEVIYELNKESKARKMSPTAVIFMMVVMLIVAAGVYVAVDAARPQSIEAARAEEFRQVLRRFYFNKKGIEIPMKFVSGTEVVKETVFYASIFVKFPIDLIDNKIFVGRIIGLISFEIEDAFDRSSNGNKTVKVEFNQPARKAFEDILEVVYLVEFSEGNSNFTDFVLPIMNQFDRSAEFYYDLLNQFKQFGNFTENIYEDNEKYEIVDDSEEEYEEQEKLQINPKVSLIEMLKN
ncbi:hypothetical protein ACKWTF_016669 [Chironomus riparius]